MLHRYPSGWEHWEGEHWGRGGALGGALGVEHWEDGSIGRGRAIPPLPTLLNVPLRCSTLSMLQPISNAPFPTSSSSIYPTPSNALVLSLCFTLSPNVERGG